MELINNTVMEAGYSLGVEPDGRELLVVAVKGTFTIPDNNGAAAFSDIQRPLVLADTFEGEPGFSSVIEEADYVPRKKRCDVILIGSAYAQGGKPATRVNVSLNVGRLQKSFSVVGNRTWQRERNSVRPGEPQPFTRIPLHYGNAFGGLSPPTDDETLESAYMANPVGKGYSPSKLAHLLEGQPLPNTEETRRPVERSDQEYRPMAFSPTGRAWNPRSAYAGTYDTDWFENTRPFLPDDFDDAYYQCAPADQQIDSLTGGEKVSLTNLTENGYCEFHLPNKKMHFIFVTTSNKRMDIIGHADTLVIWPDTKTFTITWRAHLPLKKNMHEISQVFVGAMSRAWWRAHTQGKIYYPSVDHAIRRDTGQNRLDES